MGRKKKIPENTKFFTYYNANPLDKITGDCVIRAISTATEQSWEQALKDLTDLALTTKESPLSVENFNHYLKNKLGWFKQKMPRKSDNSKYTGEEFINYLKQKHPEAKYVIANIGCHHVTCFGYFNGTDLTCVDIWDCTDRCVGNYWICE